MKCEMYIILSRVYWIFRREYILSFLLEEYEARAGYYRRNRPFLISSEKRQRSQRVAGHLLLLAASILMIVDPIPSPRNMAGGYVLGKWVDERSFLNSGCFHDLEQL